tara:strand:+ start:696 stop:974 length:279 start_codon:yes stop_codon:yes gene_type:complete
MNRKAKITDILDKNFDIYRCLVSDVSESHKGHSGYIKGEETHFEIFIISDDFKNKSRLERHKIINNCLKNEFKGSLHSITYKLMTVSESQKI